MSFIRTRLSHVSFEACISFGVCILFGTSLSHATPDPSEAPQSLATVSLHSLSPQSLATISRPKLSQQAYGNAADKPDQTRCLIMQGHHLHHLRSAWQAASASRACRGGYIHSLVCGLRSVRSVLHRVPLNNIFNQNICLPLGPPP